MCNQDLIDSVRLQAEKLISHADDLRRRFSDVEEEFREGNLDAEALRQLNHTIHDVESDAAAFDKMLHG